MMLSYHTYYDCWECVFPASSRVGGSRSLRSGFFGVCLREHGHSVKVGLGLDLVPIPSDHLLALSGARFSGWHFSAGEKSEAPGLVSPVTV